jgi:hypothetical protein
VCVSLSRSLLISLSLSHALLLSLSLSLSLSLLASLYVCVQIPCSTPWSRSPTLTERCAVVLDC